MNGRVYDPVLGRFLSADPFVQSPGTVDGYNRYSYCLNNPLGFVDPSGYVTEATEQQWIDSYRYQRDSGPAGPRGGGTQIGRGPSEAGPTYEEYMRSKGMVFLTNEYGIGSWWDSRWISTISASKDNNITIAVGEID